MAQYRTGTVNVTNGSSTVDGTGTLWSSEISVGDLFIVVDSGVSYVVSNVVDDTTLELSTSYGGTNATGENYVIARDFSPVNKIPLLNPGDIESATLFNRAIQIIDGLI